MAAVAAVVAMALAAVVPLRLDGYDAAMEDPPPSEQPRPLMHKVAPPPQVVETFERLGGIRPVDSYAERLPWCGASERNPH